MPAKRRRPARKPGPLSETEKTAIALLKSLNPDASYSAIATILRRSKNTVVAHVAATRDMLRFSAPRYLELHLQAATIAAAEGNAGPAQWALDRISIKTDDGDEVRVTDAPAQRYDTGAAGGTGGLTINVGLAVSQVAPSSSAPFSAVPLVPEVAPIDVTPSKTST